MIQYNLVDFTLSFTTGANRSETQPLFHFTDGVASLQFATPRAAALGVGGVVFLHRENGGCLGNRWCSPIEGRGWHQSRGETLIGNIHRLRLLLQSAGDKKTTEAEHIIGMFIWVHD